MLEQHIEINESVISKQYPILRDFTLHYSYYKILIVNSKKLKGSDVFWTYTTTSHLAYAVPLWCMVFGAKSNDTHWKHAINSEELVNNFRDGLLCHLGMTSEEWFEYWNQIIDFRNKFLSHRELKKFNKNVPFFQKAQEAVFYYDKWLREVSPRNGIMIEFDTLKQLADQYLKDVEETTLPIIT
ncbi:hypothetical protein ACFFIX_20270 [Metabacillus herbersteinensis]|uniref:HEPN AbiU2-like domain-containing protein n=1 Tax=Metabacillus herbersteinensis TaxID=283816 RepID=A0ABV6GJ51_9BACI